MNRTTRQKKVDKELFRKLSEQIDVISQLLLLQNRKVVAEAIEAVATTPERREMWQLIDGTKSPKTISDALNVSERTVQYFITDGQLAGLISLSDRGAPKRRIDLVPKEWAPYAPGPRKGKGRPRRSGGDEAQPELASGRVAEKKNEA